MKKIAAAAVLAATVVAGCGGSNADTVSKNISTQAEKFQVQRRIVAINGITDKPLFVVEGKCSIEGDPLGGLPAFTVTCKTGPKSYVKDTITVPDNVSVVSTQIGGISVNEYRTKVVFRPTAIIPDIDLMAP